MRDVTSAHPHTMTSASWSSSEERRSSSKHHCPYSETKPRPLSVMVGRSPLIYCKSINQTAPVSAQIFLPVFLVFFPNHSLLFCSHRFCFSYLLRSLKQHYEYSFFPLWGLFLALAIVLGDESLLVMQYSETGDRYGFFCFGHFAMCKANSVQEFV